MFRDMAAYAQVTTKRARRFAITAKRNVDPPTPSADSIAIVSIHTAYKTIATNTLELFFSFVLISCFIENILTKHCEVV